YQCARRTLQRLLPASNLYGPRPRRTGLSQSGGVSHAAVAAMGRAAAPRLSDRQPAHRDLYACGGTFHPVKQAAQILFTVLRLAIAVGLLVYLGTSGALSWPALRGLAAAWPLTVLGLALVLMQTVVVAWRLCLLCRPHGLSMSIGASTRLTFMGTFF